MSFTASFIAEATQILAKLDVAAIDRIIERPYSECREADVRVPDLPAAVDAILARAKDRT